ncbi:YpzG family protein [Aureibacillus halotolerans]|uniref:YpzG-like protein n=1 Tax=Aureibacillus halotolerans TaxID=1508390 RepID=A0A4R6TSB7_9BACI|nr:YpzG family protein [Aureibacillus halotolerans]TDQ33750.1 YpzG-like protein [Aureibacillus halotolerans]
MNNGSLHNNSSRYSFEKKPFQSPRASVKHAYNQVNGETEPGRHNDILKANMKSRV